MSAPKLGFIGFGEAAYLIAKGLGEEGLTGIHAYDVGLDDPSRRGLITERAGDAGVSLAASTQELIASSDIVIAAVTSSVAHAVAEDAAAHLTNQHIYIDINSVSPAVKIEIGSLIAKTKAAFIEVSVMAAVPKFKHKVPMVLCGPSAPKIIEAMKPYGMVMEDFGPEFGKAAAFKMFRSIMVKGMEGLLFETVLAASKYDIADRVLDSVEEGYPGIDWKALATYLIGRTAIHGERRAHEMMEVSATLKALDIDPIMAEAAARRIKWGADWNLREEFNDQAPESFHDVIKAIENRQGRSR
jgi:3-hydroxyisobutyrate dehydrogenase-like beta-hydroxyacid dehydrogenase